MTIALFLLLLTADKPLLPQENMTLEQVLAFKHRGSLKPPLKLAAAYEVVYGLTDPNLHQEFLKASIYGRKAVYSSMRRSHNSLSSWLPDLQKQYKKSPELVAGDPFFKDLIRLNQALREIANITDLNQRRQALHRLYEKTPAFPPTLVMIIDTEWALGHFDLGDQLLADLNKFESPEASWPSLILKAKQERRLHGIDAGLKALEAAENLRVFKRNPVTELRTQWLAEIKNAASPRDLSAMGAMEALTAMAKTNPEAARQLVLYYLDHGNGAEAEKVLKQIPRDDALERFILAAEVEVELNGVNHKQPVSAKTLDQAHAYLKDHPNHPTLLWLTFLDKSKDREERLAAILKAFELEPGDKRFYNGARVMFSRDLTNETLIQIYEKRIEAAPEASTHLIFLKHLIVTERKEKALALAAQCLELYPKNKDFFLITTSLLNDLKSETTFKGHFAARMLEQLDDLIQIGEYKEADILVDQMMSLYPARQELDVLKANIHLSLSNYDAAHELYAKAAANFPKEACVFELQADALINLDKPAKAQEVYRQALELNPQQAERIQKKIDWASERRKDKFGILRLPTTNLYGTYLAGVGGMYGFHMSFDRLGRPLSATSGGGWWGGSGLGGLAVHETSKILTPFYEFLLDQDAAWQDEQEEG